MNEEYNQINREANKETYYYYYHFFLPSVVKIQRAKN